MDTGETNPDDDYAPAEDDGSGNGTNGSKRSTLSEYDISESTSPNPNTFDSLESQIHFELKKCFKGLSSEHHTNTLSASEADGPKTQKQGHKQNSQSPKPEADPKRSQKKTPATYTYLSAKDSIELVNTREYTLVSIDNEFFERSTSKVIEIGISIYNPTYQRFSLFPHFLNFHFIIKEFINLRNGVFVPDSKMNNITGESIIISKDDVPKAMDIIFKTLGSKTCVVGHNISGDINSFKYLNYELPSYLKIIDTAKLWYSLVGSKNAKSSLGFILDKLNIPHAFLHNGVNDAYYTLVVCLMLVSPELRNNLVFKRKQPILDQLTKEDEPNEISVNGRGSQPIDSSPTSNPSLSLSKPPDVTGMSPEQADVVMKRYLRKKKKAELKSKKNKNSAIKAFDTIKIRCSPDENAITNKNTKSFGKSGKIKHPPSNFFFKPINYEEDLLVEKLEELKV